MIEKKFHRKKLNVDANDPYGLIMTQKSLPLNELSWADKIVDLPKLMLTEKTVNGGTSRK